MRRWVPFACSLALIAGCGGAAPQPPPASPASAPGATLEAPAEATSVQKSPSPTASPPAAPAAGAPAPMSAAPPAPMQPEAAAPRDESARSRAAQGAADLARAEQDVASGDCPTACRALGSMERSVVMICAMGASGDDAGHCADAKHRLTSARRRVQTSCGSCPGGPSVDPDAPVPSRR